MLYPVRVTPTTRALNYFFGFAGCALAAALTGAIMNIVPSPLVPPKSGAIEDALSVKQGAQVTARPT